MRKIIVVLFVISIVIVVSSLSEEPEPSIPPIPTEFLREKISLSTESGTITLTDKTGKQQFQIWIEAKYIGARKKKILVEQWMYNKESNQLSSEILIQKVPWSISIQIKDQQLQILTKAHSVPDTLIQYERVLLNWDTGFLRYLDRAYEWERTKEQRYHIDRWTHKLLQYLPSTSGRAYWIDIQAESVNLDNSKGITAEVELSNTLNHPLKLYESCYSKYSRPYEKKIKYEYEPASTPRKATIKFNFSEQPQIEKLRYPNRYKAALSFTDHADQSNTQRLRTLMFGQESPEGNQKGFAGHGLAMSKSIFMLPRRGYERQGSSSEYQTLLAEIQEVTPQELGLHTASGAPDTIDETKQGIEAAKPILANQNIHFWIDHQPVTNCESISNEGSGYRIGSRKQYKVLDVLKQNNYRYFWAGYDDHAPTDKINMFDPEKPFHYVPILYNHRGIDPAKDPIFIFSTLWRATSFPQFLQNYNDKKLESLIANRGLHIAHTYLDTHVTDKSTKKYTWTLMDQTKDGLVLKSKVEELFAHLGELQNQRKIWVSGIVAIGEHLRLMEMVDTEEIATGIYQLHNNSDTPIKGASFRISGLHLDTVILLNEIPLPSESYEWENDTLIFEMDLSAKQTHILQVGKAKQYLPLIIYTETQRQ
jgi:hypothetical protein